MKKVAINQSNYIPWKGFFDLINDVDVFVFYDDVQYTKNDWRNRNRVKNRDGALWLTIPVGIDLNRLICEVPLIDRRWQKKHFDTLTHLYKRAPFFENCGGLLEQIYIKNEWTMLSNLNQTIIKTISQQYLGSKTQFLNSSDYPCTGKKQERVLSLLKALQADVYVSGPAGKAYIDPAQFEEQRIELIWKDYSGYPEYPQFHPPFEHAVSILDLLFHTGPEAANYIWGWRSNNG